MIKYFMFLFCFASIALAKDFLLIGDSHTVGFMGQGLSDKIQKTHGDFVDKNAVVGSSAKSWLGEYGYQKLLSTKKFDTLIIGLGTNDIAQSCHQSSFSTKHIEKMLQKIPQDKTCYWIGPPGYTRGRLIDLCGSEKKYSVFIDQIREAVQGKCRFIDSRNFSKLADYVSKDTVHFSKAGGDYWSENIFSQLQKKEGGQKPPSSSSQSQKNSAATNQ
jgi:hypothetical protein